MPPGCRGRHAVPASQLFPKRVQACLMVPLLRIFSPPTPMSQMDVGRITLAQVLPVVVLVVTPQKGGKTSAKSATVASVRGDHCPSPGRVRKTESVVVRHSLHWMRGLAGVAVIVFPSFFPRPRGGLLWCKHDAMLRLRPCCRNKIEQATSQRGDHGGVAESWPGGKHSSLYCIDVNGWMDDG